MGLFKDPSREFKTNQEIKDVIEKFKALFSNQLPELVFNLSVETPLDICLRKNNLPRFSSDWINIAHQYKQFFNIYQYKGIGTKIASFTFSHLENLLPEFKNVISFSCRDGKLYKARIENETVFTKDNKIIFYETLEQLERVKKEIQEAN
jgi:hypothetical protein